MFDTRIHDAVAAALDLRAWHVAWAVAGLLVAGGTWICWRAARR